MVQPFGPLVKKTSGSEGCARQGPPPVMPSTPKSNGLSTSLVQLSPRSSERRIRLLRPPASRSVAKIAWPAAMSLAVSVIPDTAKPLGSAGISDQLAPWSVERSRHW